MAMFCRLIVVTVGPDPVAPDPVAPDPVAPDPVELDPVAPDPVGVDPVALDPEPQADRPITTSTPVAHIAASPTKAVWLALLRLMFDMLLLWTGRGLGVAFGLRRRAVRGSPAVAARLIQRAPDPSRGRVRIANT